MKRITAALFIALLAVLAVTPPAFSQSAATQTNTITPAISTNPITIGPSATSGCSVGTNGELSCTQAHTDGYAFLPAYEAVTCIDTASTASNFRATRVASNDWAIGSLIAFPGATTINCSASFNSFLQRVGGTKGVKITSIDLVYQILTAGLTTHNVACRTSTGTLVAASGCLGGLSTTVYANNTADVVGATIDTGTALATATQTNPYLTNIPITTPAFLPANIRTAVTFEWQAVGASTGIYRVYGIGVNYSVLAE